MGRRIKYPQPGHEVVAGLALNLMTPTMIVIQNASAMFYLSTVTYHRSFQSRRTPPIN